MPDSGNLDRALAPLLSHAAGEVPMSRHVARKLSPVMLAKDATAAFTRE